jgi:hypothetical protein
MMTRMSRPRALAMFAFQMKMIATSIASLRSLAPHMRAIGIDPRRIMHLGRAKQTLAFHELARQLGVTGVPRAREVVIRSSNALCEVFIPPVGDERSRVRAAVEGWTRDLDEGMPETSLDPAAAPVKVTAAS